MMVGKCGAWLCVANQEDREKSLSKYLRRRYLEGAIAMEEEGLFQYVTTLVEKTECPHLQYGLRRRGRANILESALHPVGSFCHSQVIFSANLLSSVRKIVSIHFVILKTR